MHCMVFNSYMFWTADCCPRPKIERARLDGTDRKILVIGGVQSKSDLAIDERDEKIYWAGINANKYCSTLSLGDLSPAVIFDLSHSGYPSFSLNGSGDHVYNVQRTGKEVEVFMAGLNGPKGPTARPKRFGSRGPCKVGHGGSWRRRRRRICPPPIHHPMELTERDGENREQVQGKDERTLGVNTWLLIIILLLLALELGKRVLKKVSSFLKATHPGDVQGTRAEDQERACGIEEDFTTDNNTDVMHEGALLLNYDDESPELNQQVCTAETKGACVHRGDLPFQVRQAK